MRSLRLYHIIKTFLEHGLDELLPSHAIPWYIKVARQSMFWLRNKHQDKSHAQRFRLAIETLGPVFIKFGQMLSTRRDLLPQTYAEELALLQDQVPPFAGQQALKIIEQAIGAEAFAEHFSNFNPQPLASASIAQVHTATIINDHGQETEAVIKVLRPGIAKTILADINVMLMFAGIVAKWLPDGRRLRSY